MRHIPEDELHGYLDQALSRSQCVEIERHLAGCSRCQSQRDDIAALRDRTTALLARIGPPPIVPPAFETLRIRHAERTRVRWRRLVSGAWAASLVGAVAFGWQVNRNDHRDLSGPPQPETTVVSPRSLPPVTHSVPTTAPRTVRPAVSGRLVRVRQADDAPQVRFARTMETDPYILFAANDATRLAVGSSAVDGSDLIAQPVAIEPELQGLWRTIVPDSSLATQPGDIPRVPGLPVLQMRVQPGTGGDDVTAVDQLLESGEVVRTIAGPAAQVGALVVEDTAPEGVPGTENAKAIMTVTIRQGDRMVAVTGPSQALGSLLSRVDVKRRRY